MRIHIPYDCENLTVLFSGGVDSTLLLYLLMKEKCETNNPVRIQTFTFMSGQRKPIVQRILKELRQRFPTIEVGESYSKKSYLIRKAAEMTLVYQGGYVYSGCNKVVEGQFTPTVYIRGDTPPVRGEPLNEFHLRPFIGMDKVEIYRAVFDEGIEDLLPLTRSCGAFGNDPDYECGECYFCLEKKWGEEKARINTTTLQEDT